MKKYILRYPTTFTFLAFLLDWGMIVLIGPGEKHSEPVNAILGALGVGWILLLLATFVVGAARKSISSRHW